MEQKTFLYGLGIGMAIMLVNQIYMYHDMRYKFSKAFDGVQKHVFECKAGVIDGVDSIYSSRGIFDKFGKNSKNELIERVDSSFVKLENTVKENKAKALKKEGFLSFLY